RKSAISQPMVHMGLSSSGEMLVRTHDAVNDYGWSAATRFASACSGITSDTLPGDGPLKHVAVGSVCRRGLQDQAVVDNPIEPLLWARSVAADVQCADLIVDHVTVGLVKVEGTEVVGICADRPARFFGRRLRAGVSL